MIFGFRRERVEEEEDQEIELVLFQGAVNGTQPDMAGNARLVKAGLMRTKEVVSQALMRGAGMVRIDPKGERAVITHYIDGVPFPAGRLSKTEGLAVSQMLKLLAGLNIKNRKTPQRGGIRAEFNDTPYLLRVTSSPQGQTGLERIVVRPQNEKVRLEKPEDVGFTEDLRQRIREVTSGRRGVLLAAGPPMSGVSTTAMAIMRSIDAYLFSIYNLADLDGRELLHVANFEGESADTLDQKLARVIRKEADVLFVDPIQDAETAKTIFDNADNVCFVSEMNARNATAAIEQLQEWLGNPDVLADRLLGVIHTKLIRKLCMECREAYRPNPKVLAKVGLPKETKVLYRQPKAVDPQTGETQVQSCSACHSLGYKGQTAMIEFVQVNDEIKKLIAAKAPASEIKRAAKKADMPRLTESGLELVAEGKTSLEELQRVFKS